MVGGLRGRPSYLWPWELPEGGVPEVHPQWGVGPGKGC